MVEDLLAAFLPGLHLLPRRTDLAWCLGLGISEDMRVAADELFMNAARHRLERPGVPFLEQQREEVALKEQVAKLVLELGVVARERGVGDLVGLLDRVGDDRLRSLGAVPRAIAPEAFGQALEIEKC
jgi:hypothetical protein